MGVTGLLVLLVFPVIISLCTTYPFLALVLFMFARKRLDPLEDKRMEERIRSVYFWIIVVLSAGGYLLGILWWMDVQVLPGLYRFVEDGKLGFMVPLIVFDIVLACVLDPNRLRGPEPPNST